MDALWNPVEPSLKMIQYFRSRTGYALISAGGIILDNILLPWSYIASQVILASLVLAVAYLLSSKALNSMSFQLIFKTLLCKLVSKS